MNTNKMAEKLGVSKNAFDNIKNDIITAEQSTSGEIAVTLIGKSSSYSIYPLIYSLCTGIATFIIMLSQCDLLNEIIQKLFWEVYSWYAPLFCLLTSIIIFVIAFLITHSSFILNIIVPKNEKDRCVYEQALLRFVQSGVYYTKNHSGILIFVSLLERKVKIIADKGIANVIAQETWDSLAKNIAIGFHSKNGGDALEQAVKQCGVILAKHFPKADNDENEIPDDISIMESK